jgi:hypothetical protein
MTLLIHHRNVFFHFSEIEVDDKSFGNNRKRQIVAKGGRKGAMMKQGCNSPNIGLIHMIPTKFLP